MGAGADMGSAGLAVAGQAASRMSSKAARPVRVKRESVFMGVARALAYEKCLVSIVSQKQQECCRGGFAQVFSYVLPRSGRGGALPNGGFATGLRGHGEGCRGNLHRKAFGLRIGQPGGQRQCAPTNSVACDGFCQNAVSFCVRSLIGNWLSLRLRRECSVRAQSDLQA